MSEPSKQRTYYWPRWLLMVLLIMAIVALSGLAFRLFFRPAANPIIVDNLSDRSREFMAAQTNNQNATFEQFDFSASPAASPEATESGPLTGAISTDCFGLTLPWNLKNPQFEVNQERCTYRAKILSPLSYLVIAVYRVSDFETDTGIVLRRNQPEIYQETLMETSVGTLATLFRQERHQILFASKSGLMLTVAINDLPIGSTISDQIWQTILSSIELPPSVPLD